MTLRTSGRRARPALLVIPALAVPLAIAAVILVPGQAIGAVDLPDKTPAELLELVQASSVEQFSGSIVQTSDLGIPDLGALTGAAPGSDAPQTDGAAIDDVISLATGSYDGRVYKDGDRARLQVLDKLAERNVYVDSAAGVGWFVDSESNAATRFAVPDGTDIAQLEQDAQAQAQDARAQAEKQYEAKTGEALPTPEALLDQALAELDSTTEVTVGKDSRVAGHDAYELVLTPRTDATLVGSVRFAVDGETGMALSASITPRGSEEPAFRIAFTDLTYAAPDASALTFTPGSAITVTDREISIPTAAEMQKWKNTDTGRTDATAPTVLGEGWSAVFELSDAGATSPLDGLTAEQQSMLDAVTTPVDGGRAIQTALLSVLITDDGRMLVGAVPTERLVDAASTGW